MDVNVSELSFEKTMEMLEALVKEVESGELSLDDSVKKYTLGLELSKHASDLLNKAQAEISIKEDND